jgi:hypothetical protein
VTRAPRASRNRELQSVPGRGIPPRKHAEDGASTPLGTAQRRLCRSLPPARGLGAPCLFEGPRPSPQLVRQRSRDLCDCYHRYHVHLACDHGRGRSMFASIVGIPTSILTGSQPGSVSGSSALGLQGLRSAVRRPRRRPVPPERLPRPRGRPHSWHR